MNRPRLTFQGSDVALCRRTPQGRAVAVYLDRNGNPLKGTVEVWPHELRGIGWHLGEIKKLFERLPLQGAPMNPNPSLPESEPAAPRPLLFAHHVAAHRQED